ncbi:MAG: S8 family serine peptidase [Phycisphaerales bacterium]|nr:MAG: S8 family serine peptidase [Phycisphaerales bacterium]
MHSTSMSMRWTTRVAVSAALGLMLSVTAAPAAETAGVAGQQDADIGQVSDYMVVQFRSGLVSRAAVAAGSKQAIAGHNLLGVMTADLRAAYLKWGGTNIRKAYPFEFGDPGSAAKHGLDRTFLIDVPSGTNLSALAAELSGFDKDVELAGIDAVGEYAQLIPSDADFDLQYGMHNEGGTGGAVDADIDAPEAWEIHTGDLGTVTLAIIDSGVDPHPEWPDRLIPGINVAIPDQPDLTTDDSGHGTHVAGIAAAQGNNGIGVAGVTWGASIMPVRTENAAGYTVATVTANGIIWAADHGADICNISLQFYDLSPSTKEYLKNAVDYAHERGALLIACAGNERGNIVASPARFENCMAVSYTNHNDYLGTYSNYGDELDVCAPGSNIWSTIPGDGYEYRSGTSMAAPHVSGLAALIKSYAPYLANDEIRAVINSTADDLGEDGWDDHYGWGRINAFDALTEVTLPFQIHRSVPPDGAIDARQPAELDGSNPAGWDSIELIFTGETELLTADSFAISVTGSASAPAIAAVVPNGYAVTIQLSEPIPTKAWTTVTHLVSGTSVQLGSLPADVNADGTVSTRDLLTLIDVQKGVSDPLDDWSTDIDRSGVLNQSDIIRLIDLLNGAGQFEPYLSATLAE